MLKPQALIILGGMSLIVKGKILKRGGMSLTVKGKILKREGI